jgi:hypothetical protein
MIKRHIYFEYCGEEQQTVFLYLHIYSHTMIHKKHFVNNWPEKPTFEQFT